MSRQFSKDEIGKTGGIMAKYKPIKDNDPACINCTRYRTGSLRCDWCIKFSEWKGVEQVNKELEEKGLTPYSCAKEMRIYNLFGEKEWLRYRVRNNIKRKENKNDSFNIKYNSSCSIR